MSPPGSRGLAWDELRSAIRARASDVAALLGEAESTAAVAGSAWTIGELGAHLVTVPQRYLRMLATREDFPPSLTAMNEAELRAIDARDGPELGELLRARTDELLEVLGDDGARPVPFFALTMAAEQVAAVLYGEILLHGLDLARTLHRAWPIARDDAATILHGLLPTIGAAVDPDAARRAAGTYHLRIRRSHEWTIEISNDTVAIAPGTPHRADLHVSADPLAFLLTSYGRSSQLKALLLGQIIGYGRRPWLAGPFSRVFRET